MPDYLHHFHLVRRMRKLCIGKKEGETNETERKR